MTLLSFILILCAFGAAGYGISKAKDPDFRTISFIALVVLIVFFFLIAAGVMGNYRLHL